MQAADSDWLSVCPEGTRIFIHVATGAKSTACAGFFNNRLKIRVAARPEGGKANKAVSIFMAHFFNVPLSSIHILSGETSRSKTVLVCGLSPVEIMQVVHASQNE